MSTLTTSATDPGTPEDCFAIHPDLTAGTLPVDAILRALDRANAMLYLLQGDGADLSVGFTLDHRIVMNAVDAVQGQLIQARTLLRHGIGL